MKKKTKQSDTKKPTLTILKKYKITLEQELFCQHFISPGEFYGNGTQAYIAAFNVDITVKGQYNSARANASRLLTFDNINTRINSLLDSSGFNAEHADKRLLHWMNQNNDGGVSVRAIQEFNKLKQRITDKLELTNVPITEILINTTNGKKSNTK